jgi:hypothetical protein
MSRSEQDERSPLAFVWMLNEDQLLDELLDHPSDSERYKLAFAELKRRSDVAEVERQRPDEH